MKEYKVRNMLFLEKDRQKDEKIGSDTFKIKALFEKDRMEISRRTAMAMNGMADDSFGINDRYRFMRISTIDIALEDHPDWWENAEDCADTELLETLFQKIDKHSEDFQKKLKKNQLAKRSQGT